MQATIGGIQDEFVTKFNAAGSALVYSTYLGGAGQQTGDAIGVDRQGNACVTGYTNSTDFPRQNPFQTTYGGANFDGFVSKILDGNPLSST